MECGCVICQDPFVSAVGIVSAKCGHVFHNYCIDQWLDRSNTCPECRSKVCKHSLTKLYFNLSFDSGIEASLVALKERLRAKDSEIKKKEKKIKELQKKIDVAEEEKTELMKQVFELHIELYYSRQYEYDNIHLKSKIKDLEFERKSLNDVKTIVDGCSDAAKQIMGDKREQASSEPEETVPYCKIATYCSVIQRELSSLRKEKSQLQKEAKELKCRIGLLHAENDKKIKRMEGQMKKLTDFNSSSIHVSPGSSSMNVTPNVPNNVFSGCSHNKNSDCVRCKRFPSSPSKKQVTPITVDFTETKKLKQNVVILDKERRKVFIKAPETPASRFTKSDFPATSKLQNGESISRNGLGGHGRSTGSGKRKV